MSALHSREGSSLKKGRRNSKYSSESGSARPPKFFSFSPFVSTPYVFANDWISRTASSRVIRSSTPGFRRAYPIVRGTAAPVSSPAQLVALPDHRAVPDDLHLHRRRSLQRPVELQRSL